MGGIDQEKAHKTFEFTDDFEVATAVALGHYGGNPVRLPEELQEQEVDPKRERMAIDDFAFNGNFKSK